MTNIPVTIMQDIIDDIEKKAIKERSKSYEEDIYNAAFNDGVSTCLDLIYKRAYQYMKGDENN